MIPMKKHLQIAEVLLYAKNRLEAGFTDFTPREMNQAMPVLDEFTTLKEHLKAIRLLHASFKGLKKGAGGLITNMPKSEEGKLDDSVELSEMVGNEPATLIRVLRKTLEDMFEMQGW